MARSPRVCGIRADISVHVSRVGCILNMLEIVDLMCPTSIGQLRY